MCSSRELCVFCDQNVLSLVHVLHKTRALTNVLCYYSFALSCDSAALVCIIVRNARVRVRAQRFSAAEPEGGFCVWVAESVRCATDVWGYLQPTIRCEHADRINVRPKMRDALPAREGKVCSERACVRSYMNMYMRCVCDLIM